MPSSLAIGMKMLAVKIMAASGQKPACSNFRTPYEIAWSLTLPNCDCVLIGNQFAARYSG